MQVHGVRAAQGGQASWSITLPEVNAYTLGQLIKPELIATLFKRLSVNTPEDLYAAVGYGSLTVSQVLPRLIERIPQAAGRE